MAEDTPIPGIPQQQCSGTVALLDLSFNNITLIAANAFLSNGLSLAGLDLSYNKISVLPSGFLLPSGQATILALLDLSNNVLTAFPADVAFLAGLSTLRLNNNQITTIPARVFDKVCPPVNFFLSEIHMANNLLNSESFPSDMFASCGKLRIIDFSQNFITQLPSSLFNALTYVSHINLSHNQLVSSPTLPGLPGSPMVASQMDSFDISFNNIVGILNLATIFPSTSQGTLAMFAHSNLLQGVDGSFPPDGGPYLLTLHDNNISFIGQTFAEQYLQNGISLGAVSFANNPSTCFKTPWVFDLINSSVTPRSSLLCRCAPGYGGPYFCEPQASNFPVFPLFDSLRNYSSSCQPSLNSNSLMLQVCSVFLPPFFQDTHQLVTLQGGLFTALNFTQRVSVNMSLPAQVTFTLQSASHVLGSTGLQGQSSTSGSDVNNMTLLDALPVGLTISTYLNRASTGFVIAGSPLQTGLARLVVVGTDAVSGESLPVLLLVINITTCGSSTCLNNGTCFSGFPASGNSSSAPNASTGTTPTSPPATVPLTSTIYSMNPVCLCPAQFSGPRCEKPVDLRIEQTRVTSNTTVLGVAVGIPLVLLFAFIVGAAVVLRIRMLRERGKQKKYYHIFLSYRVNKDADLVESVYNALSGVKVPLRDGTEIPIRCFWDKLDIRNGSNWYNTFVNALEHSCLYVPFFSEAAIEPMKNMQDPSPGKATVEQKRDNLFREFELAGELTEATPKRIVMFPILIGKRIPASTAVDTSFSHQRQQDSSRADLTFENFNFQEFGAHTFPKVPTFDNPKNTVRNVISEVMASQGVFLSHRTADGRLWTKAPTGELKDLATEIVKTLQDMAWDGNDPQGVAGQKNWCAEIPKAAQYPTQGEFDERSGDMEMKLTIRRKLTPTVTDVGRGDSSTLSLREPLL
jgi:hypothetical protein